MKYVVFEWKNQDGTTQKTPVIFPNHVVHAQLAEHLQEILGTPVNAGECAISCVSAHGHSTSTGLSSHPGDAQLINGIDYFHGLDVPPISLPEKTPGPKKGWTI